MFIFITTAAFLLYTQNGPEYTVAMQMWLQMNMREIRHLQAFTTKELSYSFLKV